VVSRANHSHCGANTNSVQRGSRRSRCVRRRSWVPLLHSLLSTIATATRATRGTPSAEVVIMAASWWVARNDAWLGERGTSRTYSGVGSRLRGHAGRTAPSRASSSSLSHRSHGPAGGALRAGVAQCHQPASPAIRFVTVYAPVLMAVDDQVAIAGLTAPRSGNRGDILAVVVPKGAALVREHLPAVRGAGAARHGELPWVTPLLEAHQGRSSLCPRPGVAKRGPFGCATWRRGAVDLLPAGLALAASRCWG